MKVKHLEQKKRCKIWQLQPRISCHYWIVVVFWKTQEIKLENGNVEQAAVTFSSFSFKFHSGGKKSRIINISGNIFYWIFLACWWKMMWLLKYLSLLYGNEAIRCLSPSGSNVIEMTVKLFTQGWLLFQLPPLPNSLQYYNPLPASWCPNKTGRSVDSIKTQMFMKTVGFLSMFWMDCMNYLKHCILVSDISM